SASTTRSRTPATTRDRAGAHAGVATPASSGAKASPRLAWTILRFTPEQEEVLLLGRAAEGGLLGAAQLVARRRRAREEREPGLGAEMADGLDRGHRAAA